MGVALGVPPGGVLGDEPVEDVARHPDGEVPVSDSALSVHGQLTVEGVGDEVVGIAVSAREGVRHQRIGALEVVVRCQVFRGGEKALPACHSKVCFLEVSSLQTSVVPRPSRT